MRRSRLAALAVVLATAICSALVVISPYPASPPYEYIAVPWLLALDLAAAAAIVGACAAAGLLGRPPPAVLGCGMAAVAVLADAWLGHDLSSTLQSLGYAGVPLLPAALALAPRAAGAPHSGPVRLATNVLLVSGVVAAAASVVLRDPYLDLSCQRDCLPNPLLVWNTPQLVRVLRLAEAIAATACCLLAMRDAIRRHGAGVALGVSAIAVAVTTLRLVTLTFAVDNPQQLSLRLLHGGAAACAILVAAAIAHELSRIPRARTRLDELLRNLRAVEDRGLEQCLRVAVGDRLLTSATPTLRVMMFS